MHNPLRPPARYWLWLVLLLCAPIFGQAQTITYKGDAVTALDNVDDGSAGPFPIGFTFTYFGQSYTEFFVSTNGFISFGSGDSTYTNEALPALSKDVIHGFWDDLMSYGAHQPILYKLIPASAPENLYGAEALVVQWTNYGYYGNDLPFGTFQIILVSGSNEIRFNYNQLLTSSRSFGQQATIGLETAAGSSIQYSFETEAVHSGEAIVFTPDGAGSYTTANSSSANFEDFLLYRTVPPPSAIPAGSTVPASGATDVSLTPTLGWGEAAGTDSYRIIVSTDPALNGAVVDESGLSGTSYDVTTPLAPDTRYYWAVVATNAGGDTWSEVQNFTTGNGNAAPTDVSLSNNTVAQSGGVDATIGTLSATDSDAGDTHTYALVTGDGSTDNVSFNISGDSLRADDASALVPGSYSVRVRATDAAGESFEEAFTLTVVDDVAPQVVGVTVPADGSYGPGQTLDFTVAYDEAVIVDSAGGVPYLTVGLGAGSVNAPYLSGSGTGSLTFRYTVMAGDEDSDGVTLTGGVSLGGATIRDAQGNDAGLALANVGASAGVLVDGVEPAIAGVNVNPAATMGIGKSVDVTVSTSEAVVVDTAGGTPRIALTIGSETGYADFVLGSGSKLLVFRYTVQDGDLDTDGIALGASLELNGGTVRDGAGNDLPQTLTGVADTSAVKVDGVRPQVESVGVPAAGAYGIGTELDFSVTFSEPVNVDRAGGTPSLPLDIGDNGRQAVYVSGSGTDTLVFRYELQAGDSGTVVIGSDIDTLGGTIRDTAENDLSAALVNVGETSGLETDGIAPTIQAVELPAGGAFKSGDDIEFVVEFSEAVTLDDAGIPTIDLTIGGSIREATYTGGDGSDRWTFSYSVQDGDEGPSGITLGGTVELNGATAGDAVGNELEPALTATDGSGLVVDGVDPVVEGVNPPAAGTYGIGQNLDFTVDFSEAITLNTSGGSPTIEITVDGKVEQAEYVSGSGTGKLVFRYVIEAGGSKAGAVAVSGSGISANGATLTDAAGNDLVGELNGIGDASAVVVNAEQPRILSISPDGEVAANAGTVSFTVTFSSPVTGVDATDFAVVSSGTADGSIDTVSPAAGPSDSYTVKVTDLGGTGTVRLDLVATGTGIADTVGNNIAEGGYSSGDSHAVDLDEPVVIDIALEKTGPFRVGDELVINVVLSESVSVEGAPSLEFTVGGQTLIAVLDEDRSTPTNLVFVHLVISETELGGTLVVTDIDATIGDSAGNGFSYSPPAAGGDESEDGNLGDISFGGVTSQAVARGPAAPTTDAPLVAAAGMTNEPILQFVLERQHGKAATEITSMTLRVKVTGNELDAIVGTPASLEGIAAIHLVRDLNKNGSVDAGEPSLATANELDDNGETITLDLETPLAIGINEQVMFLITIDVEDGVTPDNARNE